MKRRFIVLIFVALIAGIFLLLGKFFNSLESEQITYDNFSTTPPVITSQELARGWYYGLKNQKKTNTPAGWIFTEAGRSSCWHKADITCGVTTPVKK